MKVKEENEKPGLRLNIQKTKIMASGSITSWQIDGWTMETVRDFVLGSKISADGDCSHEIKRCLLLGRKATANLNIVLKSRDTTLPTEVHLIKAMVFPVVMGRKESDMTEWLNWTEAFLYGYLTAMATDLIHKLCDTIQNHVIRIKLTTFHLIAIWKILYNLMKKIV